jgi:DNA polymerase elongation subunit (family B)/energy-coupling factor transporter ATP-binding protein EcfA2
VDFYNIIVKEKKDGTLQIRPDFKVGRSKDLMTRGGAFYAIWDEDKGLWSTDIYDVQRLVDADLFKNQKEMQERSGIIHTVASLESNSTKLWDEFQRFVRNSGNNSHNLDEVLTFANTEVKRTDYVSKRLPYSLHPGECSAWDQIVGTLYSEEEREKIEWAIGAIASGDSKHIQKFLVFYGPPGSGKSTILNIIQKLFHGYTAVFDARELAGNNNAFATAAFKSNPLVAIQHDGDLSRIYDNTKLNSIVAHETMTVNEKYRMPFETKSNAFLFMGTNLPVKITDAKSGIIRRLIDVVPTQRTIDHDTYHFLMEKIDFELGSIAYSCLQKYLALGKNHYSSYRPTEMMLQTDVFYNFVEANFDIFKAEDGVTLRRAWTLYKEFCSETGIDKMLPQYKLREHLKDYFEEFHDRIKIDGADVRSYYKGFKHLAQSPPKADMPIKTDGPYSIELEEGLSVFDELFANQPAQYAKDDGTPEKRWENVTTTLKDIDTSKLHYVQVPREHIVIDFDLTDEDGVKNIEACLEKANAWPVTYAELSKSGHGLHLHYNYYGDVESLANLHSVGVEIKTLLGNSSLRRKLTKCNKINVTPLYDGLPTKEKKLLDVQSIKSERSLRELIIRNLKKEIHPGTKPSIDFIHKILKDAYDEGLSYDVRDLRSNVLTFAAGSSHQSSYCVSLVQKMDFVGKSEMPEVIDEQDKPIVFFDVEVYPNLFIVCWKSENSDGVSRMINPTPQEVEELLGNKLVGFNNRRYDNHILYARYLGYSNEELYNLSSRIINGGNERNVLFGEAYNLSYADIYDFSSKKQGLKKFQIELGILHMELDIPWDEPVDESLWKKVEEYCVNDVVATEAVFNSRRQDFVARKILAELSGLSVNHTTQNHTAKIIFGDDKKPQSSFVYSDLSEEFPGYIFNGKESFYKGEVTGEGGYVYAEPGIYTDVALLDVASMHPTSIECLDLFGPYTNRFSELKTARMAIKHKDYNRAKTLLDGKLEQFVSGSEDELDALSYALKIVINIVYGLTSARFDNPFKDYRNKDNIVAKRGALFMIDLKHAVQDEGFVVAHIKTDSIKIPNATPEIIQFVKDFGSDYGYDFEHEGTYEKFCLVNDAVYIAKSGNKWEAVGAQFQHPYVYKTLFSGEEITFDDICEAKTVTQGVMYLDFEGSEIIEQMRHVGRTGRFVPVVEGGGRLYRIKDNKHYAVTGTKDYSWVEASVAKDNQNYQLDDSYFITLVDKAKESINKFGNFEDFIS